jgi:hypothetical protein
MCRLFLTFSLVVFLGGCAVTGKDVEMPVEGTGTDEIKQSPCVCDPVPFNSGGFEWVG